MRIRRKKPTTREGRKRASELRRIIRNRRTPKSQRVAAQYELETLAPALPPSPSLGERAMRFFHSKPTAVEQARLRELYAEDDSGFALWLTNQYRRMKEGKSSVLAEEQPNAN